MTNSNPKEQESHFGPPLAEVPRFPYTTELFTAFFRRHFFEVGQKRGHRGHGGEMLGTCFSNVKGDFEVPVSSKGERQSSLSYPKRGGFSEMDPPEMGREQLLRVGVFGGSQKCDQRNWTCVLGPNTEHAHDRTHATQKRIGIESHFLGGRAFLEPAMGEVEHQERAERKTGPSYFFTGEHWEKGISNFISIRHREQGFIVDRNLGYPEIQKLAKA